MLDSSFDVNTYLLLRTFTLSLAVLNSFPLLHTSKLAGQGSGVVRLSKLVGHNLAY